MRYIDAMEEEEEEEEEEERENLLMISRKTQKSGSKKTKPGQQVRLGGQRE